MLNQLKNNKGFTLVEVIVVAVIVAVLALVAIQLYQGYVTESRQNTAENLGASAASYLQTIVNAIDEGTADTDAESGLQPTENWSHELPSTGQTVVFTCPANASIAQGEDTPSGGKTVNATVKGQTSQDYAYR